MLRKLVGFSTKCGVTLRPQFSMYKRFTALKYLDLRLLACVLGYQPQLLAKIITCVEFVNKSADTKFQGKNVFDQNDRNCELDKLDRPHLEFHSKTQQAACKFTQLFSGTLTTHSEKNPRPIFTKFYTNFLIMMKKLLKSRPPKNAS